MAKLTAHCGAEVTENGSFSWVLPLSKQYLAEVKEISHLFRGNSWSKLLLYQLADFITDFGSIQSMKSILSFVSPHYLRRSIGSFILSSNRMQSYY